MDVGEPANRRIGALRWRFTALRRLDDSFATAVSIPGAVHCAIVGLAEVAVVGGDNRGLWRSRPTSCGAWTSSVTRCLMHVDSAR